MNILVLNGSPHANGNTKKMINAFKDGAIAAGNKVDIIDVCHKNIRGCLACEHCHISGKGRCIQNDDMQYIYPLLEKADCLIIASPIYYHGITGQLKCVIDRLYAVAYPVKPKLLSKAAIILSSGDPDMYTGALFSFNGDFIEYLNLENKGIYTYNEKTDDLVEKIEMLKAFGASLI